MSLHWLQHDVVSSCPVCRLSGAKRAVLSTASVLPGRPPVTLLRCPGCGAAFLMERTPPDYEMDVARMLDYYVEQGAGIDLLAAPLLRLPAGRVRRCLEIGGSVGFALDFGRFAGGWEGIGVDPSPLATAGGLALGHAVRRAYFTADLDLGPEPFDLAMLSEVLEHLPEPHALLAALRDRLAPSGILVLSTPNLALVRPGAEPEALHRALSPGFHMVLYSRDALVRVLEEAGFAAVQVEESAETLRAFAARSQEALAGLKPADPAAARALFRDYFAARAASAAPGSAFACGFAYRHFKECVNAGLYEEAAASRARLAAVYRERFGRDFGLGRGLEDKPDFEALETLPFNLTGALFFSGILELNGLRRPDRAAAEFAAAVAAERRLQGGPNPFGIRDGETADLAAQSRRHLPLALSALSALAAQAPEPAAGETAGPAPALPARRGLGQALRRFRPALRSPGRRPLRPPRLPIIAERFVAPVARLSSVVLPLDVAAREPAGRRRFLLLADDGAVPPDYRAATLSQPLSADESLRLEFAPFSGAPGASYLLGVLDLSAEPPSRVEDDLRALRAAAAGRPPIALACRGGEPPAGPAAGLLLEGRGLAAFRVSPPGRPGIRVAHGLDAFWCDAHGLYLQGWVHAHEHRVRALTVESAGRSARTDAFADRPDLLAHYPAHEHVRRAGFTVYLACPPGHPVTLTLATDGGTASFPLPLPEGPLPAWPAEPAGDETAMSPLLRRFVDLVNAQGGRVLQVGSRSPAGHGTAPPRPALHGPVTGVDIHPGFAVDLVSDAHGLCLRDRSVDALVSSSVLEHLAAPWLFAAEANRVLKAGGLLYHAAPGAWPAHAQPNDFWRMSAAGLAVLFGPESGFEVLAARDSGPAALIPSPAWRHRHLAMPTVPAFAMAEILARKVEDLSPGAVAWPVRAGASEARARRYPLAGLRVAPEVTGPRGGAS